MRVLEVIRQGQIGGGESHLLDLVDCLDRSRVEPVCLSFTDGEMVRRLHDMGIRCHVIESGRAFDPTVWRRTAELLRQERIEIVHAHGSRAASNMLWPAMRTGLPLVYTVHGWSFHDDQSHLVRQLRAWSEKLICSRAKSVICVSESNALTGRRMFGLKDAVVIENGINLRRFNPDRAGSLLAKEEEATRTAFGFAEDDIVVGFIARCTKQKAPLDFLEAVLRAHQEQPRIKGLFVGEGDMDAEVDAFIASHRMGEFLFRSPFRTDVPRLLRIIDLYCLPSLWEGLSIALLEAMAMKKTIIATPTDGTSELITDGVNGCLVPFHDPAALASAFVSMAAQPEKRSLYGERARALVEERFNAQRVAEEVSKIYECIVHSA